MWNNNVWNIKEGLAIGCGLVVLGLLLQWCLGPVVWSVFAWPVNIIVLTIFVALIIAAYMLKGKVHVFRFCLSYASAVSAISFAVVMTIIMGLTRQGDSPANDDPLGISSCLTFWPFVLVYVWITWIVGSVALHQCVKMVHGTWNLSLLSHLGLFIVLVCGTLGSTDMQRLRMFCETGHVEWRALDKSDMVHELPIAIQLDSFILEEFPPEYASGSNGGRGAMVQGMPRRFASEVRVYSEAGDKVDTVIEVNKPFSIMGWKIYQYSYDVQRGKWSEYSVFELVRDPWLPVVYVGIALIALGALGMFFGHKRKEADYVG